MTSKPSHLLFAAKIVLRLWLLFFLLSLLFSRKDDA